MHPFFISKEEEFIYDPNAGKKPIKDNKDLPLVNEQVRFPQVRLIGPNGEQLGIMSSREAQFKATSYDLDLLCVSPKSEPPVCKILNYSKYRFEQQKKAKEAKKNQHQTETKEIQLTPQIGLHDMETKARAVLGFLKDGNKVKVGVRYRGRQMSHVEVGEETLNKFISLLEDKAIIEKQPAMEGKWLIAIIAPSRK